MLYVCMGNGRWRMMRFSEVNHASGKPLSNGSYKFEAANSVHDIWQQQKPYDDHSYRFVSMIWISYSVCVFHLLRIVPVPKSSAIVDALWSTRRGLMPLRVVLATDFVERLLFTKSLTLGEHLNESYAHKHFPIFSSTKQLANITTYKNHAGSTTGKYMKHKNCWRKAIQGVENRQKTPHAGKNRG